MTKTARMSATYKTLLLLTVAFTSLPAMAQTAASSPAPAAPDEAEIVVTARRGSEKLQDVPASVSVLTADAIAKTGVKLAADFVQLTPGVTIVTSSAEVGDTQINIRGLNGARDAESNIALVVDGILKTNTAALNQNQGLLAQIEVLKGPQGALYGRNAAAGAIVITTKKPGDRLEVSGRASAGNAGGYSGSLAVSAPLAENIGVVLSGDYDTFDGFYTNEFLKAKVVDNRESWNINGRLVADFGEASSLDIKGKYGEYKGASINFNASFLLPNFAAVNPAFYEDVNSRTFRYYGNIKPENSQKTTEFSAKFESELGLGKFTLWGLYSNIKNDLVADGTSADFARYTFPGASATSVAASNACFTSTAALTGFPLGAPAFVGQIPVPFIFAPANGSTFGPYSPTTCDGTQYQRRNQEDMSVEARLASTDSGAPLQWQFGGYFLHINREVAVNLAADLGKGVLKTPYADASSINPTSQVYWDKFKADVFAAFGGADYDVTDAFNVGVALRFDSEKRSVTSLVPNVTDPITGAKINPGLSATGSIAPQSKTFNQLQPKVTLTYQPSDDLTLFANWGIGFKSGGFNNQGSAATVNNNFNAGGSGLGPLINAGVTIQDQFRKERTSSFEAGFKGKTAGGRFSYELAGYYNRVTDMQFFEFFVGPFGLLRVVSNIDTVDIWGAELNTNVKVVDGWTVFGSANLNGSKIKKNSSRPETVGNKSPYTADYTINLGTQMVAPIQDDVNIVLRADYRRTGPTWFHTIQDQVKPTLFSALLPGSALALPGFVGDANYDRSQRSAFDVVNLRVGLETERWTITAFANNLLDQRYLNEVIPAIEFGGAFTSPGARRTYGVEAAFNF
jgi:iron complex outermembrane recepter protein